MENERSKLQVSTETNSGGNTECQKQFSEDNIAQVGNTFVTVRNKYKQIIYSHVMCTYVLK